MKKEDKAEIKTEFLTTDKQDILHAGEIIAKGGLVAFPTETVYGLGANAFNDEAVKKIYAAKGRPSDNPLIVHIARKEQLAELVREVTPAAQALVDAFFPAPLTIILPKSDLIGDVVSGGLDTVAVRMPENETARRLIEASGCPIAAPSANTSGRPSPTRAKYVAEDLSGKIDAIIDGGECKFGVESTVITLATDKPTVLRPGAVTKEMIEDVIGRVELSPAVLEGMKKDEVAASPGMKYKHYAPNARVFIVNADKAAYENFVNQRGDAFALCFEGDTVAVPHVTFGRENDDLSQARELFDALRRLDEMGAKKVYARIPSKTGVGMAVYNRLIRAAAFSIIDLEKPFLIGLTGQTGAGKGYVGKILAGRGFNIVNADEVVNELYSKNLPLLNKLSEIFGNDIIKDGRVDKKALANIVFGSSAKREELNRAVHPFVMRECRKIAVAPAVFDAPQLFEAGAEKDCCKIICVTAKPEIRLKRIIKRDGISPSAAQRRIDAQYSENYYRSKSDYVIVNNGEDILPQLNKILEEIL